jgi:hypothetical protein
MVRVTQHGLGRANEVKCIMPLASRTSEIAAVDAFLLEPKRLRGDRPQWFQSADRMKEIHATWGIEDSLGIERAQLRFRCHSRNRSFPSVSVIFRSKAIWRIDIVPQNECKYNPVWARKVGLPATICGPHGHEWPDNRYHISFEHVTWDLPCRRPMPPGVRRLEQAIPWLADRIALQLNAEQRGFDVPPQDDLFS